MHSEDARLVNLLGAVATVVRDALLDADVSGSGSAAIISAGSHDGQSVDELSRVLGLSHSATVRLVDRLEGRGAVRRVRDRQDRRTTRLHLTAKGRRTRRALLAARSATLHALVAELPAASKDAMEASLSELLQGRPTTREEALRTCRFCDEDVCRPRGCPVELASQGA